ncbi:MAG: prolipoprotein diacylglyceryl transferase [Candidatus Zixiibacteriota bacterium]|nr:MAG: prolipoprotein diacylglyceryl transferase [candidate division Zixibacteria bacterium]
MYPELIRIGPLAIRSYGVMLAVSFIMGVFYVYRISRRKKYDFAELLTVAYIMIIAGVLGARLFYVLFHLNEFSGDWLDTINPFQSDQFGIAGLNLYGGVMLAVICTCIYLSLRKMPVLATFDLFAPTIGLGLIFTRIGCYLNGCCFGTPSDLPWSVQFPAGSIPDYAFPGAWIHPSQLYSSLYGLILFIFLHWRSKRKRFDGEIVALLFMVEAIFRYAIEYVRYYENAMHFHILGMFPTWNQVISIILFLLGVIIYIVQSRRLTGSSAVRRQ